MVFRWLADNGPTLNLDNSVVMIEIWFLNMGYILHTVQLKVGHHWPASEMSSKWAFTVLLIMTQH